NSALLQPRAVTKKPGKVVEAHPAFGDDEIYFVPARQTHAVPRLAIGLIDAESRVNLPVDEEHRPGLSREIRLGLFGKKASRAILDIEADRAKIATVHAP